jgi:hypothetical protein
LVLMTRAAILVIRETSLQFAVDCGVLGVLIASLLPMRIRIVKPMAGVLDGHSLARFAPGLTYDVIEPLARQLVAMGGAVNDRSRNPALVVATDAQSSLDEAVLTGGIHVVPAQDIAADRTKRRIRSRLKKSR